MSDPTNKCETEENLGLLKYPDAGVGFRCGSRIDGALLASNPPIVCPHVSRQNTFLRGRRQRNPDSSSDAPANIRSECAVQLFEHGRPTEKVFVLIHGLSNCPAQFTKLGRQLFERGHNVLIPRIPYHGEQNRLATDWGALTAEDMLDAGNQAADLALALGTRLSSPVFRSTVRRPLGWRKIAAIWAGLFCLPLSLSGGSAGMGRHNG